MTSGILIIALITHHPTAAGGIFMIRSIHGLLMSVILFLTAGFSLFVVWRRSVLALIGLIPFATGAAAGFAAGTINGFIAPGLVLAGITSHADLLWASNQVLASIGIVATAAAYTLWAVDLWRLGWRTTAVFGLIAGLSPAVLLISGHTNMHIAGAILAYSANAAWALWLGIMLWRDARQSDRMARSDNGIANGVASRSVTGNERFSVSA
jgi:hypothetical protein